MAVALVTGGAGFIGRELVHQLYAAGHHIIVVDKGTYAARFDLLRPYRDRTRVIERDVVDLEYLHGADVVFHLAAESHVDNSISDARRFIETNVGASFRLLELIRGARPHDRPTLIHVSTDEVYGDLGMDQFEQAIIPLDGPPRRPSMEDDPLRPSSPYAASKAAADMLVMAWGRTYGLSYRIVRPSNCYGVWQYHEKLIPKTIRAWQLRKPMTVHGDGTQTRSWLAVEDCAKALIAVWQRGEDGGIYNVPGNAEVSVRSVVAKIHAVCLGREGSPPGNLAIAWNCERPGGDLRYRVNGEKLFALGWELKGDFWRDLEQIVHTELESGVRI